MSVDWLFCTGEQTQVWFHDNPTVRVQTSSGSGCFQLGKFQLSEVNSSPWSQDSLPEFVHSLPVGPTFFFFFFEGTDLPHPTPEKATAPHSSTLGLENPIDGGAW